LAKFKTSLRLCIGDKINISYDRGKSEPEFVLQCDETLMGSVSQKSPR